MERKAIAALFDRYERLFNAGLSGKPDLKAIRDFYADAFIGAAPGGVMTGTKGPELDVAMAAGFARNKSIGARRMTVQRLQIEVIDERHAMARVDWRATYDAKGGETVIDFTNVYLTREEHGDAKVFGWITGDEEAALRQHGLV